MFSCFSHTVELSLLQSDDWRIIFLFGSQRVLEDVILAMTSKPDFFTARRVIISNQDIPKVPPKLELFYIGSSFSQVSTKHEDLNLHVFRI